MEDKCREMAHCRIRVNLHEDLFFLDVPGASIGYGHFVEMTEATDRLDFSALPHLPKQGIEVSWFMRELRPASLKWCEVECGAPKKNQGTPLCENSSVFICELLKKSERSGLLYDSFPTRGLYLRPKDASIDL